jgi:riboflavin synthase alpha subunit
MAMSLDGRAAAPDGSSQWLTGEAARADAHRLRAESDAVMVGAGTVRADDPALTVRAASGRDPLRVVLGKAPDGAKVRPALEVEGDLIEILDDLGRRDVVQLLVEGGPTVAGAFHRAGLVDRYVLYVGPVLFGGDDGLPVFTGSGAPTIADITRGQIVSFTFGATVVTEDAEIGSSIAVNGCCLTVVELGDGWWRADVVDETLARTNLGSLEPGDEVNLERPLRASDRLGGHIVQGHVDAVGAVTTAAPELTIHPPAGLLPYVVAKGSIAVDGCSLTVAAVTDEEFRISIVPHTAAVTTLGSRRPGDKVNLEVDLVAKYVESLLTRGSHRTGA